MKLTRWLTTRKRVHGKREAHGGPGTWTIGAHLGPTGEPESEPDYIEEAANPTEADWAREETEYRAKNDE